MIFPCVPLCPRGRPWRLLLACVEIRKLLPKVSNFWRVVIDDVGTVGMTCGVVLMVGLGRIKGLQRYQLSHNWTRKDFGPVQLRDVRLGNSLLFIVTVEDGRTNLPAGYLSLTLKLRGIVRDGEEDSKKLSVGDLRRIVSDLHRFSMAGATLTHQSYI